MLFRRAPIRSVAAAASVALLSVVAVGCGSDSTTTTTSADPTSTVGSSVASSTSVDGAAPSTDTTDSTLSPTTVPDGSATTQNGPSGQAPDAPSGVFLSSHRLSLSGGAVPGNARSVCITSPGATCVIHFTKDGTTRSLPAQEVDASGATAWDWSPADIGLTVGHWDVEIVADHSGATRAVDEAIGLDVVD